MLVAFSGTCNASSCLVSVPSREIEEKCKWQIPWCVVITFGQQIEQQVSNTQRDTPERSSDWLNLMKKITAYKWKDAIFVFRPLLRKAVSRLPRIYNDKLTPLSFFGFSVFPPKTIHGASCLTLTGRPCAQALHEGLRQIGLYCFSDFKPNYIGTLVHTWQMFKRQFLGLLDHKIDGQRPKQIW